MWLLLLLSVLALGAIFDRVLYFHRCSISTADFLRGIATLIRRGDIGEAIQEAALTPGPIARVVHAVLQHNGADATELRLVGEEAGRLEIPDLERRLPLLSGIAYLAPLFGLLGTMLGLMQSFSSISTQGLYTTTAEIGGGVFQSLATSIAGLAVAIPAFMAYAYLGSRVDGFLSDMERAAIETSHLLLERRDREDSNTSNANEKKS